MDFKNLLKKKYVLHASFFKRYNNTSIISVHDNIENARAALNEHVNKIFTT